MWLIHSGCCEWNEPGGRADGCSGGWRGNDVHSHRAGTNGGCEAKEALLSILFLRHG